MQFIKIPLSKPKRIVRFASNQDDGQLYINKFPRIEDVTENMTIDYKEELIEKEYRE